MISIVLPISRDTYLKPVFDCLATLERPVDTELIIITDGDRDLERKVEVRLENVHYRCIKVIRHTEEAAETLDERRYRIADIHNQAKSFVDPESEYVFLIEDDTTYPTDALKKMFETMIDRPEVTYVEAVELGRRATPYVGAWRADKLDQPRVIRSMMPSKRKLAGSLEMIHAGGLYCCLVRANVYTSHHFEPFDRLGNMGLSCDVNFGFYICRELEGTCVIDWSIECDHIGDKGSVNIGNTKPVQVVFEKYKDEWMGRIEVL